MMYKLLCILLVQSLPLRSQNYVQEHFGGSAGVVLNFGSHVNAIGLNLKGYYTDYFAQLNASTTLYFYSNGYGKRKNFWESRNSVGLVLLAGKKQKDIDFELDALNHQTRYNYGLGYNYIMYFDNAGTSQRSGGFSIHANNFSIYHENDVFGGQAKDRFRTGQIHFSYRLSDFKIGMGVKLWTGETANSVWQKISMHKSPSGFRILEDLPFGKTSHGIAYGSLMVNLGYNQIAHLRLGVDSEQVRHTLQNRLIHDLIFLPAKIERNTPHYPRLDKDGCPVFTKEEAKPLSYYMQFGINDNWSF